MTRVLRYSGRIFVTSGLLAIVTFAIGLVNYFNPAMPPGTHWPAILMSAVAIYLGVPPYFERKTVRVTDMAIEVQRPFGPVVTISFADIEHSEVTVLRERDWPILLVIKTFGGSVLKISPRYYAREDAQWLCTLPQLKPVVKRLWP